MSVKLLSILGTTVICFVLLVCSTASEEWFKSDKGSIGLWKVCINGNLQLPRTCVEGKPFKGDWLIGVRALTVLASMIAGVAVLFASAPIFLRDDHNLVVLGNPNILAGVLLLAGSFMLSGTRLFQDKTTDFFIKSPSIDYGWGLWMGFASGGVCLAAVLLLFCTYRYCRCCDESYSSI